MYPTHAPTALLTPHRLGTPDRTETEPADMVRTQRDEVEDLRTEREVAVPTDSVAAPAPARGAAGARTVPDDPFERWIRRARTAGHPVQALAPGRYRPDNLMPMWSWAMPPNDLLDAAREVARLRTAWVHALLPDQKALLLLHRCVVTPPARGRRWRPGGPTATPWPRLVAQQQVGLCAISDTRDGVTTHVLEIPASWLGCTIIPVGPPLAAAPVPTRVLPAPGVEREVLEDRRPAAG